MSLMTFIFRRIGEKGKIQNFASPRHRMNVVIILDI